MGNKCGYCISENEKIITEVTVPPVTDLRKNSLENTNDKKSTPRGVNNPSQSIFIKSFPQSKKNSNDK